MIGIWNFSSEFAEIRQGQKAKSKEIAKKDLPKKLRQKDLFFEV